MIHGFGNPTGVQTRSQKKSLPETEIQQKVTHTSKGLKRPAEQEPPLELVQRKIAKKHNEAPYLFQCTRDEAFILGVYMRAVDNEALLKSLPEEKQKEIEMLNAPEIDEESSLEIEDFEDGSELEDILDRSESVGNLVALTLDICQQLSQTNEKIAEQIKEFALALAKGLPGKKIEAKIEPEELEAEFLKQATDFTSKLSVPIPAEELNKLAGKLQRVIKESRKEAAKIEKSDPVVQELGVHEKKIFSVLAQLIHLTEYDLPSVVEALKESKLESQIKYLETACHKKITIAAQNLKKLYKSNTIPEIQDKDIGYYHQATVKMATLVLTKSGGLNIGLFDMLVENFFGDMQHYLCVQSMKTMIKKLKYIPQIWLQLANVRSPNKTYLPSNNLIRSCLKLNPQEKVTPHHAQITVLSALLGHMRQANAGTCFATALLIKMLYNNTHLAINDFSDLLEYGHIKRYIFKELRTFPFQARMTNEELDTLITSDPKGKVITLGNARGAKDDLEKDKKPSGYLHECPGIIAACQAVGLPDVSASISSVLIKIGNRPFSTKELIIKLAELAHIRFHSKTYRTRSFEQLKLEELIEKATYAFVCQSHHPLHGAWDQVGASMVNYFGSQYMFPNWTFQALEATMKLMFKKEPGEMKRKLKSLMEELFLPMITRMRYKYNPYLDKGEGIFENTKHVDAGDSYYGYELCSVDLPKDFKYSRKLYNTMKAQLSHFKNEPFKDSSDPKDWILVNTAEKYQQFICQLVSTTIEHIKKENKGADHGSWDDLEKLFKSKVMTEKFNTRIVEDMLGKGEGQKRQRKSFRRNDQTIAVTPYKFRMGGWPDEVVKAYFSFGEYPVKDRSFSGSPREVLSWLINYLKNQPDEAKGILSDPEYMTTIRSPVHAFLLKPSMPSLRKAYSSEVDAVEYIRVEVEEPGMEIANHQISASDQQKLMDYFVKNEWYAPVKEKHDLDRQEFTEVSKIAFDSAIKNMSSLSRLSIGTFSNELAKIVFKSRAADPRIGKRYPYWESKFRACLKERIKQILPEFKDSQILSKEHAQVLIDYARNRVDDIKLSAARSARFVGMMKEIPRQCSNMEFRTYMVDIASELHEKDVCYTDNKWKRMIGAVIDTKIYKLLPKEEQKKLYDTMICGFDTNWTDSIHDIHMGFVVNPGTGKLELVNYTPDKDEMKFRDQKAWFNRKKFYRWELPGIYRSYQSGPLFDKDVLF